MGYAPAPDTFARRAVLKLGALGLLGGAAVLGASQAKAPEGEEPFRPIPARPVVDARFPSEIADGVWIVPDGRILLVPNIGIVIGKETVLVIDCGLEAEGAESLLRTVRRLAPGREILLTTTHAHPEHAFGAQVFSKDAAYLVNRSQRDHFDRAAERLLAGFRGIVAPAYADVLDGIRLVRPDRVYEGATTTIDLGGRTVELRSHGTAHTPGDQTILLREERILFAGDLAEERIFPIVPLFPPMNEASDMNLRRWQDTLVALLAERPRIVVPGHGSLSGPELLIAVGEYHAHVRGEVAALRSAGADLAAAIPALRERIRRRYPTWEWDQFIAPALRYHVEGHP